MRDDLAGLAIEQWGTFEPVVPRSIGVFITDAPRSDYHITNLRRMAWHLFGYADWSHAYADYLLFSGELARLHRLIDGAYRSVTAPRSGVCTFASSTPRAE